MNVTQIRQFVMEQMDQDAHSEQRTIATIKTNDGEVVEGVITNINNKLTRFETVTVETYERVRTIPIDHIEDVSFPSDLPSARLLSVS